MEEIPIDRRFEIDLKNKRVLSGNEKFLLQIPESVITNKSFGDKRITVLSYFLYFKNAPGNVNFSINKIVSWTGKVPNRNKGKINQKFADTVLRLANSEIIKLDEEPSNSACTSAVVNIDKVKRMCDEEHYATIYFDELERIINFRNENGLDKYMDNETILMVFVYLRSLIYQRRNELFVDEFDIDERRSKCPEAYNCYYCDIADKLGLSERATSKAIDALNNLGLIYSETLPRKKVNKKWVTNTTIFCNRYKRQNGHLLESGEEYYLREIENKKKKIGFDKKHT